MSASTHHAEKPSHILAINNDAMVLELFRDLLESEGYRVSTQAYSEKNLAEVVALGPDLIILDYMWKDEDGGWSFLQMLRMSPQTARIPIVLCTGAAYEIEALKGHLQDMGVQVILKPFNIEHLLTAITSQLGTAPPPAANPPAS